MQEPSVIHSTFVMERNYPKSSDQVFSAFADAVKKRRWFAESPHQDVEEFTLDFRIGGMEKMQCRFKEGTHFPGVLLTNEGTFQDIVLNQRLVTASTITIGDKRISASLVTIELIPAGDGTTLHFTHQGAFFEGADGPEMREAGWRSLLEKLGNELTN